jgi:hypothetical protein
MSKRCVDCKHDFYVDIEQDDGYVSVYCDICKITLDEFVEKAEELKVLLNHIIKEYNEDTGSCMTIESWEDNLKEASLETSAKLQEKVEEPKGSVRVYGWSDTWQFEGYAASKKAALAKMKERGMDPRYYKFDE